MLHDSRYPDFLLIFLIGIIHPYSLLLGDDGGQDIDQDFRIYPCRNKNVMFIRASML